MNLNHKITTLLQEELGSAEDICVIDGNFFLLSEIEKLGRNEFAYNTAISMPNKLYKFYPNNWITEQGSKKPVNYSLQSLLKNTVFMQSPDLFDDIYDSDIHIDSQDYLKYRLRLYCVRCNCDIDETASVDDMLFEISKAFYSAHENSNDLKTAFIESPVNEVEQLKNETLTMRIERGLSDGKEWQQAVYNALMEEYSFHTYSLRRSFRTSCFTRSPYSQLMWGGAYADCHRGFCAEYQIDRTNEQFKDLFYNIFPVIYCKTRPDMSERLAKAQEFETTSETLWDIYFHGALRKSIDWMQQNEWRLLLPFGHKSKDFNVPFFPISKVFLGNRMDKRERAEIIDICNQRNIPYTGVRRTPDVFEMRECGVLCENCPNFLS